MATWQVQEAKTKFSEVLEEAARSGPQIITKHGKKRAVVISIEDFERLHRREPDPFVLFLMNGPKVEDFEIERDKDPGREIEL